MKHDLFCTSSCGIFADWFFRVWRSLKILCCGCRLVQFVLSICCWMFILVYVARKLKGIPKAILQTFCSPAWHYHSTKICKLLQKKSVSSRIFQLWSNVTRSITSYDSAITDIHVPVYSFTSSMIASGSMSMPPPPPPQVAPNPHHGPLHETRKSPKSLVTYIKPLSPSPLRTVNNPVRKTSCRTRNS